MEQATTSFIVLKELAGNPPPHLNAIQQILLPHTDTLIAFWTSIWLMTAIGVAIKVWYEYKKHRQDRD